MIKILLNTAIGGINVQRMNFALLDWRRELAGSAYELVGFFEVLPLAKEAMKPLYTDY